ncbi:MAG: sigma-70 family RNA polymerase sigma factor [Planctomycetes bacterium]|nr:sigma-70 family RNA polymerase sigma factor [Planctomycetota bacterium]
MDPQRPVFREFDLTPEVLGQQGRALRGLACSLLGDAHAAEDVVQETWLACLERPRALPERVSAWLGTVTKHLALRRKRGEQRLRSREKRAALPERLEALQQRNLEREEALRAVTAALLALEEPFKTALLLRYFEERTPNEIALELGEPLATVKSRLARGLEKLRAKLGREFAGDDTRRTRALSALAGSSAPSLVIGGAAAAGSTASTIGALMGLELKAVVVAALLAGGALWWWNHDGEPPRTSASAVATTPERGAGPVLAANGAAPGAGLAAADAPAGDAQREALPSTQEPTALEVFPPEASYRYIVHGQVRDARDLPLVGARVFLAPRLFPINRAATTDDAGRFTIAFEGRRPTLDCAFTVDDGGGNELGLCDVHLVASQPLEVDVGLRGSRTQEVQLFVGDSSSGSLQVRFTNRYGSTPDPVFHEAVRALSGRLSLSGSGPLERAPEMLLTARGVSQFIDPPPARICERPLDISEAPVETPDASLVAGHFFQVDTELWPLSFEGALNFDVTRQAIDAGMSPADEPAPLARVHGLVRDASGDALAGVEVGWGPPGRAYTQSAVSDESGVFALTDIPAGEVRLRAGGGDLGRAEERVTLVGDQDLAWNPLLERGDEVSGRVLSAEKKGLVGLRVELWSASSSYLWSDSTLTNEDGRFAIPNVPSGAYELHVYSMEPPSLLPLRVVRPVYARTELGELVLAPQETALHTLKVVALDPRGAPLAGAELRVWHADSGRGALVASADEQGALKVTGLSPGAYRLELGGPLGWRDLGTTWLEDDLELGAERFAAPGVALLDLDPMGDAGQRVSSSLWSAHSGVFGRVEAQDPLGTAAVPLRAGAYVLCARTGSEHRAEASLEITSAAASALTLRAKPDALEIRPTPVALGEQDAQPFQCSSCHSESVVGEPR